MRYKTHNQILISPQNARLAGAIVSTADIEADEDGGYAVRAGTPLYGVALSEGRQQALELTGEKPRGIVLNDTLFNKTEKEVNVTLVIGGTIDVCLIDEDTRDKLTSEVVNALPQIEFVCGRNCIPYAPPEPVIPQPTVTGIEAIFTQGKNVITISTPLEDLKQWLTVNVLYSDRTKKPTTDYTLLGDVTSGFITITVNYNDSEKVYTTSFVVEVQNNEADIPFGTSITFNDTLDIETAVANIKLINMEATTDGAISYFTQIAFLGDDMYFKNGANNPEQIYNTESGWVSNDYKSIFCVDNHTFTSEYEKEWFASNTNFIPKTIRLRNKYRL